MEKETKKFTLTCKVDYTYITQLKLQKIEIKIRWYYTALHWLAGDVCRVLSLFLFLQF